jgi:hypothetical protein
VGTYILFRLISPLKSQNIKEPYFIPQPESRIITTMFNERVVNVEVVTMSKAKASKLLEVDNRR